LSMRAKMPASVTRGLHEQSTIIRFRQYLQDNINKSDGQKERGRGRWEKRKKEREREIKAMERKTLVQKYRMVQ
jgi:hypothetical protein